MKALRAGEHRENTDCYVLQPYIVTESRGSSCYWLTLAQDTVMYVCMMPLSGLILIAEIHIIRVIAVYINSM